MNLTKPQKLIYDMERFAGGSINVICGCMLLPGAKPEEELIASVNRVFQLNDALRIRVSEEDGQPIQQVIPYTEKNIDVLHFASKAELDSYAQNHATVPFDFYGDLCDIKVLILPDQYGLLVKFHHIVGDAWTIALIGTQFNTIMNGEEPSACSYCEYVESEKEYLESQRYENDRTFFLEQFKKCDEVTYLSEKQAASYNATRKTFVLDAGKTQQIKDYATQSKSSAYALFMTALAVYMNRTNMNAEKFYLGTAVLNRSGVREKRTMGMFVNTVPMLIELENGSSFAENLSAMGKTIFSAFRHQKFNYGDVLSAIRKEYNFSEKLYDVMLSYQNATITGGDCETTWYHCGMQNESLQIHIDDRDREGIFRIHYDYQTDKFTAQEIDALHNHLMTLLQDAIRNDTKKLYELELLPSEEKQKVLFDFNDTAMDYPRDKCVHQLFEEQVAKTPDKVALIACDKTLTYAELNDNANRIAHALAEKGVKKNDIVAFQVSRKSHLITLMLGTLKAGASYMPIDPNYPKDRVDYMVADSDAKFCVTDEMAEELLVNSDATSLPICNCPQDLFCVLHTSGSTGLPKGAAIKHQNMVNFIYSNLYLLDGIDNVIAINTVTFDVFEMDTIFALITGTTCVLANEEQMYNQTCFENMMAKYDNCLFWATPTKITNYINNSSTGDFFKHINCYVVGGEILKPELLDRIRGLNPNVNIYTVYGPTETLIYSTLVDVSKTNDITIGHPIANTQIYIVDQFMQPTPVGVIGELCIAGDGVAAGYINRPDLTEERFINNPFGEGKLYKTGDLTYWREDGNIGYVGRNDFQVKIRGLRVELGEIEKAIANIDGISQVVVVVRKNNEGRQLICAFYTGLDVAAKEIRNHIGKKLPKYMLPHICTHLDEMPLTSSGKVNRKALPDVDLYAIDNAVEYVAPTTEQEKILVTAMESVLGGDRIGVLDNFFDVGGDSLKAIELISKLEKQGYHTDTKTIFACETVKELAEQLALVESTEDTTDYSGDIPATDAQMRVYTAQSTHADSPIYNVPYAFTVCDLDAHRLQTAIDQLIARHESLRTYFENKDGHIIQVVNDTVQCPVERLATDDITAFIRPFDLGQAPLLRVGYYENTVMIDMHHIITDGSSMPIFLRELNELYMGRPLENSPVQYKQFAVQKQDHTKSEKYWLSIYSDDVPVLEINTDFHRGQKQSFNGSTIYDKVESKLHNRVLAFCKEQNITPYVFYMGAFNVLLSKFSGNEDVVVGMPISGRNSKYLDTIGMFVNTIALRNQPVGTKTVADFLQEVKANSVAAMEHQDYPYGELVKKLHLDTPGRNPLFDVMFAYQSEQMTDVVFGDQKTELLPIPITTAKYDFTFNVMPRDTGVVIMAEYCTDLFKENTVQRFVNGYKLILAQMLDSQKFLKDISAITDKEYQKLLHEFNNTAMDYPRDKCVHQLFEEQVAKTPDKVAVVACDKTLTYTELNEQANRIAHALIAKGVKKNDIIAFQVSRKSCLIALMLGVLKAGASYMPIDPNYPKDRVEYMVSDAGARFCVTDENVIDLLSNTNISNPQIYNTANERFCVLHTSGSTGLPKSAAIKHMNMVNFIYSNLYLLAGIEKVIAINTVTFDVFEMDTMFALIGGVTCVLASEEQQYNQSCFEEMMSQHKNCLFWATPTKITNYINNSQTGNFFKHINCYVVGGEILQPELLDTIRQLNANIRIYTVYGPTETLIYSTLVDVTSTNDITIGHPIANTQVYIVDRFMLPTPLGVTGELCIAGDGVGAGYLNKPELTAEKFIDNPFGEGRLYRTGDLTYWREDGNIAYVGRNDFQVKIRGLRIELGEIENAIDGIDGISQAVVVVRKNSEGRQLICAFYTGLGVDAKEIRNHIGKKLPKYMLPHIFTHLNEMPLTSSSKVNRKALPEVDLENITNDAEYVPPENKQQKLLCGLMEQILDVTPVGIADDFFDLGGDSLKAIEFVSKAHNEGIYFNLQNVFDYPTVKELWECIENGDKQEISFTDVDFSAVNAILEKNKPEYITAPQKTDVGNILLAGATGYLGVHILADFLEHDSGTAYCLVRGKDQADSTARLNKLLGFYFGGKYVDSERIQVICADLQKDSLGLDDAVYTKLVDTVDTVINTAASVKHYGSYKYFYEANVETTKRLIDFCKTANAKLIHTSTLSVSGNTFGDEFDGYISETEKHFYESSLYIGQPLDNVYARSKFEAEKAVLDAMTEGLQANIMRMGNLTNRLSDGVFQKNYESNAFLQRVKGVLDLGIFPDYLMDLYAEFTPIDEAANAVMTITRHFSTEQTVFHINSIKVVYFNKLLEIFNALGFDLKTVSGAEFTEALRKTAEQTGTAHIFEAFINDMDENDQLSYDSNIRIENDFTVQYLKSLGFEWADIGMDYLRKYVEYFKKIGYLR